MARPFWPLGLMFAGSGLVALGCETAWLRSLTMLMGASLPATGTLLAVFMLGLCLGAELGARVADSLRQPLRVYALAEAIVALWSFGTPWALRRCESVESLASPGAWALLAFGLLGPPTVAMGATLPLLCAALCPSREALGAWVSRLYSVNLAGAVVGTLLSGFVLLPRLGITATLYTLGAIALCVSLSAMAFSREVLPREREPGVSLCLGGHRAIVAIAVALGALSFALQVAWNRALGLLLGSSSYTFAMVSSVILCGLGFGGARAGRGGATGKVSLLARRCFALGMSVYLGVLAIHAAPFALASAASGNGRAVLVRWALTALVVGWSSYEVGAMFPLLAAVGPRGASGRASGRALVATTTGNIVGAVAAAFVVIPARGVQWTLTGCAATALGLSVLCALCEGLERARSQSLGCVLAVLVASVIHPTWDRASLSAGSYRVALYRERRRAHGEGCDAGRSFRENRVLFARDGALGTVLVLGHPGGARCSLYSLRINGKSEGSVFVSSPLAARIDAGSALLPEGDLPTEVLAGWLGPMAGAQVTEALVVGWGTGLSARALLETQPGRVTAVELEPAVLEAARIFDAAALDDPRVRHVLGDARTVIRTLRAESLDVIASHPSNPWVVGASSLFSLEYFALARSRLRAGGRMLAWVQLYETDRESVRSLIATFLSVFPDAHAFRPSERSRDLVLLGINRSGLSSREELLSVIAGRMNPRAEAALSRAGIHGISGLRGRYLAGGEGLARYSRGALINTQDNGVLEYRVADRMLRAEAEPVAEILRGLP